MFFSTVFTAATILSSMASAAPTKDLPRRDVDSCTYAAFGPGGYGLNGAPLEYAWTVVIPNDSKYDKGGCGQGFSDNFGGQCGEGSDEYNSFNCNLSDDGTVTMTFLASNNCDSSTITQAINLASYGALNTVCTGPPVLRLSIYCLRFVGTSIENIIQVLSNIGVYHFDS